MSTTQELQELLDRAVRSLVVPHRRGQQSFTVADSHVDSVESAPT